MAFGQKIKTSKFKLAAVAVIVTLMPQIQGCFPAFLAAGAGAGYLATDKQAQKDLNAFLDDIAISTRKKTTKIKSEGKTKKAMQHGKGKSPSLELIGCTVTPEKVQRLQQASVRLEYAILGAGRNGAEVTEIKSLWYGKRKVARLASDRVQRTNGTWESVLTFTIPASADNGKHTIKQEVTYNQQILKAEAHFTVY